MEGLRLGDALQRREWAALRVLAAAVTLREIRLRKNGTPGAWMNAHDELALATDSFVHAMEIAAEVDHAG
jgi:hypothetical protein